MPEVPIFTQRKNPLIIEPGELWNFIRIQRASRLGDTFGKSVNPVDWEDLFSCWAAIYSAGGREVAAASHLVSSVSHVLKIRYTPSIIVRANHRIIFGARYFTVGYIENVKERNRVLLLYATEIDGGGQ
jgi:SPP1 family predicted phage head-tail adaptor